ncbi:MAG: HDOD domain-containing protein [bacterium]|nr:HDOD domain-containing protein [bacterium]
MDEEKQAILGKLFSGNKQLPTIPELYAQFNKMLENPMTSNKKVADLLKKDPSMVTKTLKLSNSALYAKRQEITSLTNAITFLGMETLKNMILQISLVREFQFENESIPRFKISTFWEHSLATAYFSTIIVKKFNLPPGDHYYIGGLLHDIGKLVVYQYYPEKFEEIIIDQVENKRLDFEAEMDVLGVNHTDIGVFFAEKWKFKPLIAEAIGSHHSPLKSLGLNVSVVRLANMFSKAAGLCFPWDVQFFEIVGDPTWETLSNYTGEKVDLENVIADIMEEADKVKESVMALLEGGER